MKKQKIDQEQSQTVEILRAGIEVVNQRLLCVTVTPKQIKDPKTGLYVMTNVVVNDKTGKTKDVPRFIVSKTSSDLPLKDGPGELPTGTEVFPFVPPAEEFQWPTVFDPVTSKRYVMLEWLELVGYIVQPTE
jgi:hypothetical protein